MISFLQPCGLFFKEIRTRADLFSKTNKKFRTLTIYSEHRVYGKFYESLIAEFLKVPDLNLSYITSDFQDPRLSQTSNKMKVYYLNALLAFCIPFLDSKALLMTMPDLNLRQIRRSEWGAHHFYIFHGLVSTHMIYQMQAFDYYDTIFCAGPHHEKEIRKREEIYGLKRKNLVAAGYPLLDKIYADHQNYLKQGRVDEKLTCLIAPSWAPGNIMESCFEKLVQGLMEGDCRVIVRPHPEFVKRRPEIMEKLIKKFEGQQNLKFEINSISDEFLHQADVLITDWSGIALEYAFGTERPVLYIDTLRKVNNPEYEKLGITPLEDSSRQELGIMISVEEAEKAGEKVREMQQNRSHYRENIIRCREKAVYHFGDSARQIAQYLVNFCAREPLAQDVAAPSS